MDIDEARDVAIRFGGLSGLDEVYTFYHDETNNIKKLRVSDTGLNVSVLKAFALGGVVHAGPAQPIDLADLRKDMKIQPSAPELKCDHVAKGDFLTALASPRLTAFLRWLQTSGLQVHYFDLDPLYWSIVDIIDSILSRSTRSAGLRAAHAQLKSDLHAMLRNDLPATVWLFHRYGYPSLAPGERLPFIADLLTLIERQQGATDHAGYMMVKGLLQEGAKVEELPFIEGNPRHLLIEEFSGFYRQRLILFKNATHVFDAEAHVQAALAAHPLTSGGRPVANYRFADSKMEAGIQVSDVAIGLLGKMHSFFLASSPQDVSQARAALTGPRLENALLLRDLVTASDHENRVFLHHTASLYDIEKIDRFLQFRDGRYV